MDGTSLLPRFALRAVNTALNDTPAVVVQGARQVGKSTLAALAAVGRDSMNLTLDNSVTLLMAKEDPMALVSQYPKGLLIIDEAQRAPELVLPLKASIDQDRHPGRFLLTGSADLLHVKGVSDSLAGRAETVELMPLSQGELNQRATPEDFVSWLLAGGQGSRFTPLNSQTVIRGGFPEPVRRDESRAQRWFTSYIARLADHDARELQEGGYADRLESLLSLLAAQGQSELVKAHLARDLGVSETTIDSYLRLARTMRLTVQYPAWNRTPHRRLIRRPKISLLDTGLSAALAHFTNAKATVPGGREFYGSLVEQFVALELMKQQAWSGVGFNLFHYRDSDGLEVDLIAETEDNELIAIEVKSTTTVTQKLWSNLHAFRERYPDRHVTGVLLHSGDSSAHLHGWLHILPVTALWEHSRM